MKKTICAMTMAAVVALFAATANAEGPSANRAQASDWRQVWHGGHWWYWTPQNSWLYWTGSAWTAYQPSNCPPVATAGQPQPYTTGYGNYDSQDAVTPQATYASPGVYQPAYSSGGSNYAGYGWSWGPGTASRDAPMRRF
jgi:opacity protein-like surface antigen